MLVWAGLCGQGGLVQVTVPAARHHLVLQLLYTPQFTSQQVST